VTPEQQRAGALEAIERIVNRGGDADEVLNAVRAVVDRLDRSAAADAAFAARVATLTSSYHSA
jgi:DNA-binding FrmR family transcriptional regulator